MRKQEKRKISMIEGFKAWMFKCLHSEENENARLYKSHTLFHLSH